MRRTPAICPSCEARHMVPPVEISPNFVSLPLSQEQWRTLQNAAEAFDRAASNLQEDEGTSGTGDGESLFTAATFIQWIKPDCLGFRDGRGSVLSYDSEGKGREDEVVPVPIYRRSA